MKTLVVYFKDSYYKYQDLYNEYIHILTENKMLEVYKHNQITGEDLLIASFKNWDYFLIQED